MPRKRIEEKSKKGLEILKREGPVAFLRRFISFMVRCLYIDERYLVYEWRNAQAVDSPPGEGYDIALISDAGDLRSRGISHPDIDLEKVISDGGLVFCVLRGDDVAHISVVSTSANVLIDPLSAKMDYPREGYIGACVTLPGYRRRGLYTYVISYAGTYLSRLGKLAVITTLVENAASIKGIENAGFTLRGRGRYTKMMFWESWKEVRDDPTENRLKNDSCM